MGPTAVGTGAAVASAMVIERIAAGHRPIVAGAPDAPHTLTHIPDLARAMLHAARHAERLAPTGDVVLHAPSAAARSQRELIALTSDLLGQPVRRPLRIPLVALRALSGVVTFARELSGISKLWYEPCGAAARHPHHPGGPRADAVARGRAGHGRACRGGDVRDRHSADLLQRSSGLLKRPPEGGDC